MLYTFIKIPDAFRLECPFDQIPFIGDQRTGLRHTQGTFLGLKKWAIWNISGMFGMHLLTVEWLW